MSSSSVPSAFSQEGNIFSIYCSNCEFLLDFQKFTIIVVICIAPITNCYPSWDATYKAQAAKHVAAASPKSRKRSTLCNTWQ